MEKMIVLESNDSKAVIRMNGDFARDFMNSFITLLVIIDPIGTVPLLAALTHNMSEADRGLLVRRGVMIAACVLLGFAIFGHLLLQSLGVSFSSFRIAGGIILFLVGLQMVFADHSAQIRDARQEHHGRDVAVFPLALPYIAGPGAMLAVMVEMRATSGFSYHLATTTTALLAVMAVTLLILLSATKINRVLGRTGGEVIGRVMGILLAALAAESVVRGTLEALGRPLN
jgi:multiple antibiotic resistance protein